MMSDTDTMQVRVCDACGSYFTTPIYNWFLGMLWLQCRCGYGKLVTCKKYKGESEDSNDEN